jgi:transposase
MGKPYSVDLRKRIIGFVEGGRSRRDAADHFEVSASCAIKLMDRWNQTGSAAPGKRGGSIGKLTPHKDFLLARVKEKADITMPELAAVLKAETSTEAAPASLSRFLIRHGQRFKKNIAGKRTKPPRRRKPAR